MEKKLRTSLIGLAVSAGLFCAAFSMLIAARLNNPRQPVKETACVMLDIKKGTDKESLEFSWECRNCEPTSYQPFRKVNSEKEETLKGVSARQKFYVDESISSGNLYAYSAAAFDSKQEPGQRLGIKAEPMYFYYDKNQPETELQDFIPRLDISSGENGFALSWGNTPNIPITGYKVERCVNGVWETEAELSGDITGYSVGKTSYIYRIAAFRRVRDDIVYSQYSNTIEVKLIPAEESVTEITGMALKDNSITVSWHTPNCIPTSYQVFRGVNGEAPEPFDATAPQNQYYRDEKVEDNTLYCYQVGAFDSTAEKGHRLGVLSEPVFFYYTSSQPSPKIDEAKPAVKSAVVSGSAVTVSWSAPSNVPLTSYRIEKETSDGWTEAAVVSADTFQWSGNADAANYRVIGVFETLSEKTQTLPSDAASPVNGGEE